MVAKEVQSGIMVTPDVELPKTGLKFTWNESNQFFVDEHHIIALYIQKPDIKIMGLPLSEWIPANLIQSDSHDYFIKGKIGPSGFRYQGAIDGDYYEIFKSDFDPSNVLLHPDSDCNNMPLLVILDKFIVLHTPLDVIKVK